MSDEQESIISFSEDVADAEAPVPLPVGLYPAVIRGAEVKMSNAGNKYAAIAFHIAPEDYPADYDPGQAPDGTTLIYRRVQLEDNQRARYAVRKFCEAIGAPTGAQIDVNSWVNATATVKLMHDTYEGETRAQIVDVQAA